MVLILHKDYKFSHKDIGKRVLLANSQVVKVLTVIREAGQLHSVIGVMPGFLDVIEWNANGESELPGFNIVMLFNEEDNEQSNRQRNRP